jgi:hypothetical protein
MPRMNADGYGLCRTPDGRAIPCNQPLGNGLAQLAMMLRGSGWLDQDYAASGNAVTDTNQLRSANTARPAYENSWAAMPSNVGPFDAGSHLPITKAQEFFFTPADPYIETLPWRPYAPEYIPYPPRATPLPPETFPMPEDVLPPPALPLEGEDATKPTDEECGKQWADAIRDCVAKAKEAAARGNYNFDFDRCKNGLVSADCGGNAVDWGPPRKKFRPYKLHTEIQA